METILTDESPLAAYLEGKGEMSSEDEHDTPSAPPPSYAPRSSKSLSHHMSALVPARISRSRFLSRARDAYAAAVTSTLGNEDNVHFLEHFRYIIIASQLLDEHVGPTTAQGLARGPSDLAHASQPISFAGAAVTALAAFVLVWVINWTRGGRAASFYWGRVVLSLLLIATVAFLLYAYSRRQWLKHVRTQAVDAINSFTDQMRSFDSASTGAISLIQEVELVSRGYRLSTPMPPISRLESSSLADRKCARLRREASKVYKVAIEASITAIVGLGQVLDHDDLERFLEVYDIKWQDLEEARLGFSESDEEERDSIRTLRVHQFRLNVLRRLIMCSLLSIPATGRKSDIFNWRTAITEMDRLGSRLASVSSDLVKHVNNEDLPTPLSPTASSPSRHTPQQAHIHSQVRRIATLTTSIRALQAKLYLLREDSTKALSCSTSESDVNTMSTSLREQYESLGTDLKALMSAWEAGKTALQQDINRHSRRVSRSGSLSVNPHAWTGGSYVQSPMTPQTPKGVGLGLASLIEDRRADTLRRLSGEHDEHNLPLSPPATDDGNNYSNSDAESRDDVYEAVSLPSISERSSMTREQRIARMKAERAIKVQERESRDAGLNMVKELKGVIRMRPQRKAATASRQSDPVSSSFAAPAPFHERISSL